MKKVFLVVGHGKKPDGTFDPGAAEGAWNEQKAGDIVVKSAADTLRAWGVEVKDEAYQDDPNFVGSTANANAWGADYVVSVHHDWNQAPKGFFALWYTEAGHKLGNDIEAAVKASGFALREYPYDGYRGDLYILKNTKAPTTLIECGRIGEYTPDQLEKLGVAVATGIANHLGISKEDEMTEAEIRDIVRSEIDAISAPEEIAAAQDQLVKAGIMSKTHPAERAASVGLVMLLMARLLDQSGVDLSEYELQLVPKK